MKRSEMVDLIYEVIYQHNKKPDITIRAISELILAAQEQAGMLPPTYERDPNEVELKAGMEKGDAVFVTEWEPEE